MQINLTIVHVLPKQAPNLTTEKQISGCLEMRQRGKTVRLQRGAKKWGGRVMNSLLILTVVVALWVYTCVRTD